MPPGLTFSFELRQRRDRSGPMVKRETTYTLAAEENPFLALPLTAAQYRTLTR